MVSAHFSVDKKTGLAYNNQARVKREFLCAQKGQTSNKNITKGE